MKFTYKFSNLLGTVYRLGDIIFSHDGNTVICPVGNKISVYDLRNNRAHTLPIEARYNYTTLALAPNGIILIAAEEDGEVHIINLNFRNVLYRKRFNRPIKSIKFSPDGKHFALTKENGVFVYIAPGSNKRIFDPFVMERVFHGAFDDTTCLDWSHDSRLLAVGSRDMTTRICALTKFKNLKEYSIGGIKDTVVGTFFEEKTYDLCTVSADGHINAWDCSVDVDGLIPEKDLYKPKAKNAADEGEDDIPLPEDEEKTTTKEPKEEDDPELPKVFYKRRFRVFMDTHMGKRKVSVTAAQYHKRINMLVVAFASGDFVMLDMKDKGAIVHSLNISNQTITSVAMNQSGDWMALGVSSLGQLVVWEWQSESFILKQQGHFNNMRVVLYSPDGQNLATGGEDGKVKLWSCQTSFCFVTFSEHTAAVTGLAFTQSGRAIITSSLDGTVRAFDLTRYRNFKTLTSTRPTQFSCVTVDCSGELVASGSQDSHDIYLWSLQTGRLLEVLAGHQGPVSSVQFSSQPGSTLMVSTGWDGTVKVWDAISNTTSKESIGLSSDGLCVCIRPDGKQIAVATMDGQITMFNPSTGQQEGNITGRNDLGAGRADADKITAKKNLQAKSFTSICYSSDGKCLLAGGQGKNVCIYSIDDELLIKKFEVTQNRSFDAMDDIINRRKMAENGINLSLIEERDNNNEKVAIKLPGTRQGNMSLRAFRPEVRVSCLTFSPTGRSWAASTTEGLLVYSLDNNWLFDPLDLDFSNTPSAIKQKLKEKDYSTALMMAVRLNINTLKQEVIETIPVQSINVVVSNLTQLYVEGVLAYIAEAIESTRHIGLYSHWATALVTSHGNNLKTRSPQIMSVLNGLQKSLVLHHTNLSKVCSHNEYMLSYLLSQASLRKKRKTDNTPKEEQEEDEDSHVVPSEEQIEDLFDEDLSL
ncbi:periodic tryptophan protein 2 homolog [Portunus trituberculatus]|uniref:periodic tryptophan protein 2 homolog n=1 Tax=Portunus trituberculatus TaxID=210409 RepID=UPI001E1D042C|nr:periodic tryptophan protein 2 homolog [Portunus trituberculatus]XP_045109367.1 periodic tryptophan protein 2 homolog [Portunus trituberculatus]XP_045109368.1 periodic tryptophan protein 2 homolog [Portunus trituberculatus]XP_045109369.1 periodic tryptophan protein 2 homolog [Portunus trituberculatus]XP_045109371.1 periodic tryptophan protein 2 homolog [Portunus trituberculatus]XP_045109372.1 periodic tryptophan protein 2 homolog [Portunus trituberculatus]XP_045109373.1 periodic tryptophan 